MSLCLMSDSSCQSVVKEVPELESLSCSKEARGMYEAPIPLSMMELWSICPGSMRRPAPR